MKKKPHTFQVWSKLLLDTKNPCARLQELYLHCIDIIPSQPRTHFVIKCTQLFSLKNWTSLQAAALAAIFRVTIGVISSNSK